MNYSISLIPVAEADLAKSKKWYEERRVGLGEEFVFAIDAAVNAICRNPMLFPVIKKNIRRALSQRFPFGIFFIIDKETIIVLAVLHCSRNPKLVFKRVH